MINPPKILGGFCFVQNKIHNAFAGLSVRYVDKAMQEIY